MEESSDSLFASPAGDEPVVAATPQVQQPPAQPDQHPYPQHDYPQQPLSVLPPPPAAYGYPYAPAPRRPSAPPKIPSNGVILGFAAGAVALVLLFASTAVWLAWPRESTPPVAAPSSAPAATQDAAPAERDPADYVTGTNGLALPGMLTDDARLPQNALPLPDGQFADALRGWALGLYDVRTETIVDGERIDNPGPVAVYLASPQGALYQVLELPRDYTYYILRWKPRQTQALIAAWDVEAGVDFENAVDPVYLTLDLLTGDLAPAELGDLAAPYIDYLGKSSDGRDIWLQSDAKGSEFQEAGPQRVVLVDDAGGVEVVAELPVTRHSNLYNLNPGGTMLAVFDFSSLPTVVIDLATGEITERLRYDLDADGETDADTTGYCQHVGWFDDASLVAFCTFNSSDGWSERGDLYRFSVFTGQYIEEILSYDTALGQDLIFGDQITRVGDKLIFGMAAPESGNDCLYSPYYVGDGEYRETGWIAPRGEKQFQYILGRAIGPLVYAYTTGSCPSGQYLAEMSVLYTTDNNVLVMFPAITIERGEVTLTSGLTSAAVGIA